MICHNVLPVSENEAMNDEAPNMSPLSALQTANGLENEIKRDVVN